MKIKSHKGVEADQSHNYTIEVTRTELHNIYDSMWDYIETNDELTKEIIDSCNSMLEELDKFVETK
jgi:hypothetical protein